MRIDARTRALVTGASRGIGRAVASSLLARGATVGLAARTPEALPGGRAIALPCDVADRAQVEAAVERFVAEAGGIDLVIANAGISHYGPVHALVPEDAERMTQVNWLGTYYTVTAALPHLVDRAEGHVVIVSSGAGLRSFPGAAVYGATKAAQRGFGEALRHELGGSGVGLTMVYPGEIASSLHDHEKASMPDWYRGGPDAAGAEDLAAAMLAAVEADRRALYFPRFVRVLGAAHGLSPKLADRMLRVLRGGTAAPRVD